MSRALLAAVLVACTASAASAYDIDMKHKMAGVVATVTAYDHYCDKLPEEFMIGIVGLGESLPKGMQQEAELDVKVERQSMSGTAWCRIAKLMVDPIMTNVLKRMGVKQ